MNQKIVNDNLKYYINKIDDVYSLIDKLKLYPLAYIFDQIKLNKPIKYRIGSRSLLWLIESLPYLISNKIFSFELTLKQLVILNKYYIKYYKYKDSVSNDDEFFSVSACLLNNAMINLIESVCDSPLKVIKKKYKVVNKQLRATNKVSVKNELKEQKLNLELQLLIKKQEKKIKTDYKNSLRYLKRIRNKNQLNTEYDKYLYYWTLTALEKIHGVNIEKQYVNLFHQSLEKQLSLNSSYTSFLNPIVLALSTNICYRGIDFFKSGNIESNVESVRHQIIDASNICFSTERKYFEKRIVINTDEVGYLQNLHWEEIYIILGLPHEYLPDDISLIDKIINSVEKRILKYRDNIFGVVDESGQTFPRIAPYYTGYVISLLTKILVILKDKLKSGFINSLQQIDSNTKEVIKNHIPKTKQKNPILDTVESTYYYLNKFYFNKSSKDAINTLKESNTMLLFGPPGTGKTSFGKTFLAQIINHDEKNKWKFINLNPRVFFVSDSFSDISENINDIFNAISRIDYCLFFLDETEELIRERKQERDKLGRMLTAAMLLYLDRINKSNSFFIFATNYINKMDEAAIRKGRFSIRKGLGWICDKDVDKFVRFYFRGWENDIVKYLKLFLKGRPIQELIKVRDELKHRFNNNTNLMSVEKFLTDEWKSYLNTKTKKEHLRNCRNFDDFYTPPDSQVIDTSAIQ